MSNPLSALRRIIAPSSPMRGVVVAVENGVAKVATRRGLVECAVDTPLRPGAEVTITNDRRIMTPQSGGAVYWA
ncbi:MAG: hypothetical protein OEZ32_07385 [Nitrospinota bacterium]|nr:hypothetical protein [Nitrospinota bacterium]